MFRERIAFGFVQGYFRLISNVLYSYQQSFFLPSYIRGELFSVYSDPFRSAWFSSLLFSLLFLTTLSNSYGVPQTLGPSARPWEADMTPLHPTLGVLGFHLCPNGSSNSGGIMDGINFGVCAGVIGSHFSSIFILGVDHARKTRPFTYLSCCFLLVTSVFYLTLISGTTVTACGVNPNAWAPNSVVFQPIRFIYYICVIPPLFVTLCKTGMMSEYRRVAVASGLGLLILASLFAALASALQTLTVFWVLFYIAFIIFIPTSLLIISILKKVRIVFNFSYSEYFVASAALLWLCYLLIWLLAYVHEISQSSGSTGWAVLDFFLLLGIIRASLDLDLNREEAIALFNNINFPPEVDDDDLVALTYSASLKLLTTAFNVCTSTLLSIIGRITSMTISIKSNLLNQGVSVAPVDKSVPDSSSRNRSAGELDTLPVVVIVEEEGLPTSDVSKLVRPDEAENEAEQTENKSVLKEKEAELKEKEAELKEKEEQEQLEAREALAALTNTLFTLPRH